MVDPASRVPPHSDEAEQAVLACVIADNETITLIRSAGVSAEKFYRRSHGAIFRVMCRLSEKGQPIDLITLKDALTDEAQLEEVGGFGYLVELAGSIPTTAHAEYYAGIVVDKALLREVIRAGSDAIAAAYEHGAEGRRVHGRAQQFLIDLDAGRTRRLASVREIGEEYQSAIEAAEERQGPLRGVVAMGYYDLDQKMSPAPGELYIVAARPAMGKTAFALNIADRVAQTSPVVIFSAEMDRQAIYRRLVTMRTGISAKDQMGGHLTEAQHGAIINARAAIYDLNLYIDDSSDLTVDDIRAACRKLTAGRQKPALVMVDYLQLLKASTNTENRVQEIGQISRGLKRAARELELPLFALSQLSRAVESRPDKRPILSDLRESGSIEQDADAVLMLYRDDYYAEQEGRESTAPGLADVLITKHRNGPVGSVRLKFDQDRGLFQDYDGGFPHVTFA